MIPWRTLTAADRRAIVTNTRRHYPTRLGRLIASRRAARLREGRPLTDQELQNEVTLAAVELIGEDMEPAAAFARARRAVARKWSGR